MNIYEQIEKEFEEKGADLEHERWIRWQKWCHKVLRENCPSPELEKVLERWDRQIAMPYSMLSEKEKEEDRKQTRNYLPLLRSALHRVAEEKYPLYIKNYNGKIRKANPNKKPKSF